MALYWFFFLCVLFPVIVFDWAGKGRYSYSPSAKIYQTLLFLFLLNVIGLRHQVGGDWYNYLRQFREIEFASLSSALSVGDPAYQFISWLAIHTFGDIYLVNLVCGLFFLIGLFSLCFRQPRPWLAILCIFPYMVVVVAMGYTRQSAALGFSMLALTRLMDGKIYHYLAYIALATLFHKSAIILAPFLVFYGNSDRLKKIAAGVVFIIVSYYLYIKESLSGYIDIYIGSGIDSSGAYVRVAMSALTAIFFLIYKKRMGMNNYQENFWKWMSYSSLGLMLVLFFLPSSTVVDRIALYWMPLQLVVLNRLPLALGGASLRNDGWYFLLISIIILTFYIWLVFSTWAHWWIPYRNVFFI